METKSLSNEISPLSTGEVFHEVLDKTALAVVTDINDTVTFVNDNFCRASKYTREEVVGKSTGFLTSDFHSEAFYLEIRRTVSTGETWVGQIKSRCKDGSVYWVQTTIVPLLGPDGIPIQYLTFGIDITSQKSAMEQIAKIREHLYILANNFPNGFINLIDADLKILFTGGERHKEIRRDPESMIGKHISEVLSPETVADITKNLPLVLNGETVTGEIHSKGKDYQSTFSPIFELDGSVDSFVLVVQDITEKTEKERELVENKEILENIADNIPGMVMRYAEHPDGRREILYVSKGVEQLLEISQEEVVADADSIAMRIHQDEVKGFYESISESRSNLSILDIENRIVMEDGKVKWISFTGMPKRIKEGVIIWNILVLDITGRRKSEELVEKNMEILSFQNKQLLDFCNIVSHNLRSPLINLSMLIGFIEESQTEDEKKGFVEKMKPVIQNLNETFEELVESIQIRQDIEIVSEDIPVEEYLKKMIGGLEGQILKTGAKIETDFSDAPIVRFPPKYFSSILHNLISNALKYHAFDRQPEIKVITRRKRNGNVVLVVQDNGLGINLKKHGESLFKMRKVFHRHPDARGFGLFITKTQVESMNGKIWAESEPNKGSSFYVEFRARER